MSITSEVYFISADRAGDGWARACQHRHPNLDDADKCAEKRNAQVIVCDPNERKAPAIVPAPYLSVRRERRRLIRSAEQILKGNDMQVFTVQRDDGRDLRFRGVVLGTATSSEDAGAERWTEITIFKTDKGNYVASIVGKSRVAGEVDRCKALSTANASDVVAFLSHPVKHFLTIVAKEALEASAGVDTAFAAALVEEV